MGKSTGFLEFQRLSEASLQVAERVQGCFNYSMNGKAPALDSPEVVARLLGMEEISLDVTPRAVGWKAE